MTSLLSYNLIQKINKLYKKNNRNQSRIAVNERDK